MKFKMQCMCAAGICLMLFSACSFLQSEADGSSAKTADSSPETERCFWGYKDAKPVEYLLITSYYEIPYGLAESARKHTGIAYVMIPGKPDIPDAGTELMFRGPGTDDKLMLKASGLSRFIAYLRPRTVIILGNRDYVSESYRLAVPRDIPVYEICDDSWKLNALKLSELTESEQIYRYFTDLDKKKKSNKTK